MSGLLSRARGLFTRARDPEVNNDPQAFPVPCLPPLPTNRERAVSSLRANPQFQALFFSKLPFEIRTLIYEAVLGRRLLHVARMPRRLTHIQCWYDYNYDEDDNDAEFRESKMAHACWGIRDWNWLHHGSVPSKDTATTTSSSNNNNSSRNERQDQDKGLLALPKTCRRIYVETIDMIYATNIFHFRQSLAIRDLAATILPARLNTIHTLHLDTRLNLAPEHQRRGLPPARQPTGYPSVPPDEAEQWSQTWKIVAAMDKLATVRVMLEAPMTGPMLARGGGVAAETMVRILEPCCMVRGKDFVIVVDWHVTGGGGVERVLERLGGDVPFRVVRI